MMTLYSGPSDLFSQQCRFVLFEKQMNFQIIDVDMFSSPDIELAHPYNTVPVLIDRELVLYEANIINEYIDERFPHPQLMPADPVMRARARLFLYRFEKELFSHVSLIEQSDQKAASKERQTISDYVTQYSDLLSKQKYLLGNEFSMLDISFAPFLWRLDHYGVKLGKDAAHLMKYAERIFSRPAYLQSMTPTEKSMRT